VNFLQLVTRTARECGITVPPTTVVNPSGAEATRLIGWVQDAWNDIQTAHQDWEWMRTTASFQTVDGQAIYTPLQCGIADGTFGMWLRDTFRCYTTAVGTNDEIEMAFTPYESWRTAYQLGALRLTRTRPIEITITPQKSIGLGPYPNGDYTVTGDYYTAPVQLTADADIPACPVQYHMAIVWKACMSYGAFEAAPEVYQRGELEFGKLMRRMTNDRLPEVNFGGALA
jgi:hypothetical protein